MRRAIAEPVTSKARSSGDDTVTLVLLGPPGSGKSTLGNLLASPPSQPRGRHAGLPFLVSEEFESVGTEVAHADFVYEGVKHRVIDTSGPCSSAETVAERLAACAPRAPLGVDAFVFVIAKGRFTDELYHQLVAFQDAAGPGSLDRTVLVFTNCGRETSELLQARCTKARNDHVREIMARVAEMVAVDSMLPSRRASDRDEVLEATAQICHNQRDNPKPTPANPAELKRRMMEMDARVSDLSGERREAMQQKLQGLRSGCASLDAVASALQDACEHQLRDEQQQQERLALASEVAEARRQADALRVAAASLTARQAAAGKPKSKAKAKAKAALNRRPPHVFACCTPVCRDMCNPCRDNFQVLLHEWREDRHQEIVMKFAEADARADAMMAAAPRTTSRRPSPPPSPEN